jgi:excisionase family DNA binding protein
MAHREDPHRDDRIAYDPEEAARLISRSRNSLYKFISSGELPSFKLGGKRLILRDELLAFIAKAAVGPDSPKLDKIGEAA